MTHALDQAGAEPIDTSLSEIEQKDTLTGRIEQKHWWGRMEGGTDEAYHAKQCPFFLVSSI